jgi:hypothetical protein
MKKLIFTSAVTMLAMRSPAPIGVPAPVISSIIYSQTDGVTVTVYKESPRYPLAVQMTTDLTTTNWISLQTNNLPAGTVAFTNLPATNATEFFRAASLYSP